MVFLKWWFLLAVFSIGIALPPNSASVHTRIFNTVNRMSLSKPRLFLFTDTPIDFLSHSEEKLKSLHRPVKILHNLYFTLAPASLPRSFSIPATSTSLLFLSLRTFALALLSSWNTVPPRYFYVWFTLFSSLSHWVPPSSAHSKFHLFAPLPTSAPSLFTFCLLGTFHLWRCVIPQDV